MKLVGFSRKATLNEELESGIVRSMRDTLAMRIGEIRDRVGDSMFLVQLYDDCEWTPDTPFTHIVAVEAAHAEDIPDGMMLHVVPEGRFIAFRHLGSEAGIDETYAAIPIYVPICSPAS